MLYASLLSMTHDASREVILNLLKEQRQDEAIALIDSWSLEDLRTFFDFQSRKTTLLCEAALNRCEEVVNYLLGKGIDPNEEFEPRKLFEKSESILSRIIFSENFNEQDIPVCQRLIERGAFPYIYQSVGRYKSFLTLMLSNFYEFGGIRKGDHIKQLEKIKLLEVIMGNDFYKYILADDGSGVPLFILYEKFNDIYSNLIDNIFSYIEKETQISHEYLHKYLAILLISSHFDSKVVSFVKKLLSNPAQEEIITKYNALIESNYTLKESFLNENHFFSYPNEQFAFREALNQLKTSQLNCKIIDLINKNASIPGQPYSRSAFSIYRIVPLSLFAHSFLSLRGFIEIKELEYQKKWFHISKPIADFDFDFKLYPEQEQSHFEEYIDEYNHDMAILKTREDKFKRIIKLGSDLSRMHFYDDANKRTSFMVLNCELIKNKFLPTRIEHRMILRGLSQDEIIEAVLIGMDSFLAENKNMIDIEPIASSPAKDEIIKEAGPIRKRSGQEWVDSAKRRKIAEPTAITPMLRAIAARNRLKKRGVDEVKQEILQQRSRNSKRTQAWLK